ncbi:GNAT family N-acetyltransferase [Paludicola sp. MB14-C6]|uniref:GNAT family N-acetyltransferase n=1 Tax=Paludihabitans sp. MB14-C6 TaxID=3070656 RepID=UPI0027DBEA49|nr:GNAT family N-acetyltransferase [Paludicola sp. MB14-C6]WMJ23831.1 GNAT family N-acetyltransferase [Paludicola sp. MB14-C6]
MDKIFETKRLYARKLTKDDWNNLSDILQDEQAMYAYEHAFSDEEVTDWLNRQLKRYEDDGIGLWALIDKKTGKFVGQAGLTKQNSPIGTEFEIGYLLKRSEWHKGYATEAAIACKEYAFTTLGLDRVVSFIRDNNYSSQAVAKRVGLTKQNEFTINYYNVTMPHYVYVIEKD